MTTGIRRSSLGRNVHDLFRATHLFGC